MQALLARWFEREDHSETERLVLADELEATGSVLGRLCALQLRLAAQDEPIKALINARLGSRESFGSNVLYLSNDYGRWKTGAEDRVRDGRVRFELIKLWREVFVLIRQLESAKENELTSFSTFVSIDRGVPAGFRTTAQTLLAAAPLQFRPPHLEVVCAAQSADLTALFQAPVLEGLPSLALSLVGFGSQPMRTPGTLKVTRLAFAAAEHVDDRLIAALARLGWLSAVEELRVPEAALQEAATLIELRRNAKALKALVVQSAVSYSQQRLHHLGELFENPTFKTLRIEGWCTFSSYAEWNEKVGLETTWRDLYREVLTAQSSAAT